MGLTNQPRVKVEGAGASVINPRLASWQRIDAAGIQSDQLTLTVDTTNRPGLPKEGAELQWFEGYGDVLVDKGRYRITRISPRLFPPTVTIVATAAPFQLDDPTGFKERRSRSFEALSLADLFRQVVEPHGFSSRVAPEFEQIQLAHIDQQDETDAAFLTRIAKQHDAVAKPVSNLYVLARRGQLKTITGQDIPPVKLSAPVGNKPGAGFINCQLERPSRAPCKGVKARWTDTGTGQEHDVVVGQLPYKRLRQSYESQAKAEQACRDELRKQKRQGESLRLDLPGDPGLVAEGLLELDESFPAEMAGRWSIDKVTARGDKGSGYRCAVVATVVAGDG